MKLKRILNEYLLINETLRVLQRFFVGVVPPHTPSNLTAHVWWKKPLKGRYSKGIGPVVTLIEKIHSKVLIARAMAKRATEI